MLPPGSTIGVLGGGQLGRMLALAAAPLGLKAHVYAPEAESPAAEVAARWTRAPYDDEAALAAFAASVDVVTTEFENVPARTAEVLARRVPVRPNPRALAIAQDRVLEKTFARDLGLPLPGFRAVETLADLVDALDALGRPAVLKTRRLGYDGKGQVVIRAGDDPAAAFEAIGRAPAVLEAFVPFATEASIVLARGVDGAVQAFDVTENRHEGGILRVSRVPARVAPETAAAIAAAGARLAEALDYVGVLAVECFVLSDGAFVVNEMAPRVHNSGHWTLDACPVSQFEAHIRAVAGWPVPPLVRHADAEMENLIGDEIARWPALAADPGARPHLYGKSQPRPGRKMGHVTRLFPKREA
jgi:5-(carboxyamino)imidazole ribonucleotide synthase